VDEERAVVEIASDFLNFSPEEIYSDSHDYRLQRLCPQYEIKPEFFTSNERLSC